MLYVEAGLFRPEVFVVCGIEASNIGERKSRSIAQALAKV